MKRNNNTFPTPRIFQSKCSKPKAATMNVTMRTAITNAIIRHRLIHSLLLRDIQITSAPYMPPTPHARSAHRPIKATFAPAKACLPDATSELSIDTLSYFQADLKTLSDPRGALKPVPSRPYKLFLLSFFHWSYVLWAYPARSRSALKAALLDHFLLFPFVVDLAVCGLFFQPEKECWHLSLCVCG